MAWVASLHHLGRQLLQAFLAIYQWVVSTNQRLPNAVPSGFLMSYAMALLFLPLLLYAALAAIWATADVGAVRKSMTSFLVVAIGVPLYPLLTILLNAMLWLVIGVFGLTLSILGPMALLTYASMELTDAKGEYLEKQRKLERRRRKHGMTTQDLTCCELLWGLSLGVLGLCSFGVVAVGLVVLKAPVVIASFILRAAYRSARQWLSLVKCCGCHRTAAGADAGEEGEEESDDDEDSSHWWLWFPLIFVAWSIALACGICLVILGLAILALAGVIFATVWPAWIGAGWIRVFNKDYGQRRASQCCTPLVQGMKAGYQVVWAADIMLNVCIAGRLDLASQIKEEFLEIAQGDRAELSAECGSVCWLPPVVIGLFEDSWDVKVRALASQLGVSENAVKEAWRALARGMIRLGREAIDAGLLTKEWVSELPSELILGLPARTLFEAVERSPPGEVVLASGLRLTRRTRPKDSFSRKVWRYFQDARAAYDALQLMPYDRNLLCAALLAGGGEADALPAGLAQALRRFEDSPAPVRAAMQAVVQPLMAIAVECSRKSYFKNKLQLVIQGVASDDSAAYEFVTSPELTTAFALMDDDSDSSAASESDSE